MLPLATTTISVQRLRALAPSVAAAPIRDPYGEGYDTETDASPTNGTQRPDQRDLVARGVRAHISSPSGSEQRQGGSSETLTWTLGCEDCPMEHYDWVLDESTGQVYEVVWVARRTGLGLDHITAGLRIVKGVA
jgi:hypothetical protein